MRTRHLPAALLFCAVGLPSALAADNWPVHARPDPVISAPQVLEREQIMNRLSDYKMPSASRLAREITLEIVTEETRTVSLPPVTPIGLEF